jgi:ankyrin repeat protein
LHEAAWRGYSETVEVLCAAGAKLSLENAAGFVPLHLAAQHGHNQTARMLLLAGCDPDIPNTVSITRSTILQTIVFYQNMNSSSF